MFIQLQDLRDPEMAGAVLLSLLMCGTIGWIVGRRFFASPLIRSAVAGFGALSAVATCTSSMMIFGSIGGGLFYVPLAFLLSALHTPEQVVVGKVIVAISTAVGCALIAWLACTAVSILPAVTAAAARRTRS